MQKTIFQFSLILLCLGFGTSVWAEAELKGSPAELAAHLSAMPLINTPATVSLSGQAVSSIHADSGRVLLRILTEHVRFQEALEANRKIRQQLIADLTKAGISQKLIQESNLSSTPQYGLLGNKPKQYRVENTLKVTIAGENELQEVARQVDRFDEVHYQELEFIYPQKAEQKRELMALALEHVGRKKQLYEQQLGVALRLKTFSEGSVLERSAFAEIEQRKRLWEEYSSRQSSEGDAPVLTFGELIFEAGVTVEYVIESP